MVTSYGETSGFAPVSSDELTLVNGGVLAESTVAIILASIGLATAIVNCVSTVSNNKR